MILCGKTTLTKPAVYCLNGPFCGKTGQRPADRCYGLESGIIEIGIRDTFQAPVFQYRLQAR
jgi:hypothetical protein